MATPPDREPTTTDAPPFRPELRLIEASETRERRCADCGKTTSTWEPVRRKGVLILLCAECAAKPPPPEDGCPQCGAPLGSHDAFCGRCGFKIEYECPQCSEPLDPVDTFCGRCGTRIG